MKVKSTKKDMSPEEQVIHFAKAKAKATTLLRKMQEVEDNSKENAKHSKLVFKENV